MKAATATFCRRRRRVSPNWPSSRSVQLDDLPAPAMHIFRAWHDLPLHTRLVAETGHTFGDVAIRDNELFIGDFAHFGVGVWRRNTSNQWYRATICARIRLAQSGLTVATVQQRHRQIRPVRVPTAVQHRSRHVGDQCVSARPRALAPIGTSRFSRERRLRPQSISSSGRGVLANGQARPYYSSCRRHLRLRPCSRIRSHWQRTRMDLAPRQPVLGGSERRYTRVPPGQHGGRRRGGARRA